MNISFSASAFITGIFPQPPGAGRQHPFELRAGPFFGGELQVVSLRGRERVNDVYRYDVTFATDIDPAVVTTALFGLPACLSIKSGGHDPRVIQGIASSVQALGCVPGEEGSKRRRYAIEIVPKLWLLQYRRQNRIFQNKTVPQIVKTVLEGVGLRESDCHWRLDRTTYPVLPFVYQRGETDYDFFRRILASAGIFFFFEHPNGLVDSIAPGASAVAGAVDAAAGMLGGAVGAAVGDIEAATGMVTLLNFGDAASQTAAVEDAVAGLAGNALQAGLGAVAGALGGIAGSVASTLASAIEEPSDTLAFDDDVGADADVERIYEFELTKSLRTKELRMLDRDVEAHESWVGVASVPDASAALNVSAGLSIGSGGISVAAQASVSFDVDAPSLPASMLRQEVYQTDLNVWRDTRTFDGAPPVSLSVGMLADSAGPQDGPQPQPPDMAAPFYRDAARDKRLAMELARVRRKYQQASGKSDCRRMAAGYRFTLSRHPIGMLNGEYTITAFDVVGVHPDFLGDGKAVYRNRFRCVPSSVAPCPKRPKRRPKPGMEVATVIAYDGNDILPGLEANAAGYVRVRFRWDVLDDQATPNEHLRLGTDDAQSVWLPVVQPWAGAGYGAQFIPREGMEVLVGFLENQSERPVILGCLYSNLNPPPWPEYVDHQKVGIRSQTRAANGGWSELSIDDRQGDEVVQFRAQKDMREDVLHDRTSAISHDRTTTIGHDSALSVAHDRSVNVTNDQSHTIGGTDTVTVIGDVTEDLRANVSLTVKGATTETLFGDLHRTHNADVLVDTLGETHKNFTKDYTERHKGHRTIIVGTGAAHRSATLHVEGTARAYAAKPMEIESLEGLSIICGSSQLLISPKGITLSTPTLTLAGKDTEVRAGTVAVASTGDLKLAGATATVQTSGAKMALDSSTATLMASQVKLGSGSGATSQTSDKPDTITKIQMKDPQGKPRANARVLLTKGGKEGEQRMTVLDENGYLELIGTDTYQISFPDDKQAK
jgi:uncharacterized protein involved in type VI secretion and phage assembly